MAVAVAVAVVVVVVYQSIFLVLGALSSSCTLEPNGESPNLSRNI